MVCVKPLPRELVEKLKEEINKTQLNEPLVQESQDILKSLIIEKLIRAGKRGE